MFALGLLTFYCAVIIFGSLLGGWLPSLVKLTHTRLQAMVSFVAGLMLGVSLLHLLPHAVAEGLSINQAVGWMLGGLLGMFFLVRAFHFHHHVAPEELDASASDSTQASSESAETAEEPILPTEEHSHTHHHHHDHDHGSHELPSHSLSWLGVFLGLSLHTAIDGIALAAAVKADAHQATGWGFFGLELFLAVLLHKPLDALSITSLMIAGGWQSQSRQLINGAFALMCPLGAIVLWLGVGQAGEIQPMILGAALACSAGVFLCISLGDLLPEVHFHSHDRLKLSAMLLLGVALAYAIGFLEPAHRHDDTYPHTHTQPTTTETP
ncbi:Zinc and cadmium transporter [Planctomycetales bacterium 10988]|nr:Zinc and cadmium transporter [Planctomycetales bacterium 10988]